MRMSEVVVLTKMEALMAMHVGAMRHFSSIFGGREDRHGANGTWDLHIAGAMGELCVARVLGIYWDGAIDVFKKADLGADIQVRTRSRHEYELIVRDDDDPSDRFVLVTGSCPHFIVRGYIRGEDAQVAEWRHTHGNREPAFFVPQSALLPITGLQKELK
jgi:hypothetical protein